MTTASSTHVPGRLEQDAADLHRALEAVLPQVERRVRITGLHLAGYSLGGAHAAYLARLDRERGRFGFQKVLLINPPVSLFSSIRIVDAMFDRHLGDPVAATAFANEVFAALGRLQAEGAAIDASERFLFRAWQELRPRPATLESLIGLSFRLSSTDLAFVADVMTRSGYVVARDATLTPTVSLTNVFISGTRLSFEDFLDGLFVPFFRRSDPSFTRERAIAEQSLYPLEAHLRSDVRIGAFTNADDIILAPGELAWLERVLGPRALVFPRGGHLGNIAERRFVRELGAFFAAPPQGGRP